MASGYWQRLQSLFEDCLELPPEQAEEKLRHDCPDDPGLRRTVLSMLEADRRGEDAIAGSLQRSLQRELDAGRLQSGQRVGAYTIRCLIGAGGMGAVYLAERSDEVYQQDVVIKVVGAPAGGISHARFRRERQILASLNHPYIARLLDGGALENGMPYLVMEHVDGCDIATWCERGELNVRRRLDLMMPICEAVQYLHSNLVVHRDIKPENVLVDEQGVPRLLDFGIAKLLDQGMVEPPVDADADTAADAMHTVHGNMLMSPAWASPEQHRGDAVTTASDIFSLGALLYRLLAGMSPREAAAGEGGDATPLPSRVLEQAGRQREARAVRGDLDAICARAMASEPAARYASAADLSGDLKRHLARRPVEARGGGWMYVLGRFARRNRALTATSAAMLMLIVGFAVGMTLLALRLEAERARVAQASDTTQQVADFMVGIFANADPAAESGERVDARTLLDRGARRIDSELHDQPDIRSRLLGHIAKAYHNLGVLDRALELYNQANRAGGAEDIDWQLRLERANLQRQIGQADAAEATFRRAVELLSRQPDQGDLLAKVYNDYGILLSDQERLEEAERSARRALAVELTADDAVVTRARFRHNLAIAIYNQDRYDDAIRLLREVIRVKEAELGTDHPSLLLSREVLAQSYRRTNDLDRAEAMLKRSIEQRIEIFGESSSSIARVRNELANVHHDAGEYPQAEAVYREALAYLDDHPGVAPQTHAYVINNLGILYEDMGDLARAEPLLKRSLQRRVDVSGSDNISTIRARINLVRLFIKQRRRVEADAMLSRAAEQLEQHYPDNDYRHATTSVLRALLLAHAGDADRARMMMAEALATIKSMEPENSRRRAAALAAAVRLDRLLDDHATALERIRRARVVFDATYGKKHPKQLRLDIWRARSLVGLDRHDDARDLLEASLPSLHRIYSDSAPIVHEARNLRRVLSGDSS